MTVNRTLDTPVGVREIQELISLGATVPLTVTGSSMLPFLYSRTDTVWLSPVNTPVRPGDVLFYLRPNGAPVLHRVRRLRKDGLLVMNGDAQSFCELIPPSAVVARADSHTLRGGKKRRSARSFYLRLLWLVWYPTLRLRPALFRLAGLKHKLFNKKGRD